MSWDFDTRQQKLNFADSFIIEQILSSYTKARLMKRFITIVIFLAGVMAARAQKVDSIFFHLYTDSLKKGTYNYINVDGKLSNGHWLPLTSKEIIFTASAGSFDGNSLFVARDQSEQRITIKAALKTDTSISIQTTIYIKKTEETEPLKNERDIMKPQDKRRRH